MGRIPLSGFCKIAEGAQNDPNGNPIPDDRSIQKAIRGTLANPALADVGNFSALNALARLDMFVPKRTGAAQQASDYRGFPRPTVEFEIVFFAIDTNSGALDLRVKFNNRVGYPIAITVKARIGNVDNSTNTKEVTRTFQPGDVNLLYIFEWTRSNNSSEDYFIAIEAADQGIYEPASLSGTVSIPADPRTPRNAFISVNGFSCYDPADFSQTNPAIHYWTGALTTGTRVENSAGNPIADDTYISEFGDFIYTISGGNGVVSAFQFCTES